MNDGNRSARRAARRVAGLCICGRSRHGEYARCLQCYQPKDKNPHPQRRTQTERKCPWCKETRPVTEFGAYPAGSSNPTQFVHLARLCDARKARWLHKNPGKLLVDNPAYTPADTVDARMALIRLRARSEKQGTRLQVIRALGGRCACCGESQYEFLAIDHVAGDGAKERREIGCGNIPRHVLRQGCPPERYRLLCHNCNQAREIFGICPHQRSEQLLAGDA